MKAAVFLPNWIGDVVMATPALRALRRHLGPEAVLVGVMKPYVGQVLEGTPWLNEAWHCNLSGGLLRDEALAVIGRMRKYRFDLAVLLPNTLRSALAAWLGGVRERAGYVRYHRGPFLTIKLHPPRLRGQFTPVSTLDYYLRLAYALGCAEERPAMELATTGKDERSADVLWRDLGLRSGDKVVVINSSGAFGGSKLWPDEHFGRLAGRIATELDHDVLVLCGPGERRRAARIAEIAHHPRVMSPHAAPLSIGLSKAVVRRCRLMVTTDSGPRHFAAAFGVPVIALFGPTHIAWTDTHFAAETRIQLAMDCGPCQKPACPEGHHRCMRELSVGRVYADVRRKLAPSGA